jgi:hypothetical protein
VELQQAPPLVYLVAPALRFHPSRLTSFETGTLRDSISRLLKQGRRRHHSEPERFAVFG